ncbi:MAG TPA: glycosyltransferase family 1 protein [Patescibacteria group bacterium]|nr:glycosyltransferase family 1 protein [Patescibacteria group bacterium]
MNSKKSIVVGINASFIRKPNTGIGQVSLNFIRKLAALDNETKYILYLEEDLPKKFKLPKNFEKRIFLPTFWKRDDLIRKIWWEKCLLPKKIRKDNCDIFFSLYQSTSVFRNAGVKHFMLVHDIIPKLFPQYLNNSRKRCYQKMTEFAIKKADKILTVSRRTEKDLIQHLQIDPEKISVNYIDVDEAFKSRPDEKNIAKVLRKYRLKPGYILAGGGLELRKNIEGVIRAYHHLNERYKSLELPLLVIYGKLLPALAPLVTDGEKLARELNLTKKIKFLDMTPQAEMPALFSQALMFVYPSHYEGFGMPPLEAMNQGIPTIVGKNSSLPEVGGDGVLYCNSDDIYDIAMVMKNVMSNRDLHQNLSIRAKMQAEKFSWDKFTEKFLNIIKNVCDTK